MGCSARVTTGRYLLESTGTRNTATIQLATSEMTMVKMAPRNMMPIIPSWRLYMSMGTKTTIVVRFEALIGASISCVPSMEATRTLAPLSRYCWMLSRMTIEESMIIPTPRMSPVRVIMFSVIPAKYMASIVTTREMGMDSPMMIVGRMLRMKMNTKAIARPAPSRAEMNRSLIVERMSRVSSERTSRLTPGGRIRCSSPIFA